MPYNTKRHIPNEAKICHEHNHVRRLLFFFFWMRVSLKARIQFLIRSIKIWDFTIYFSNESIYLRQGFLFATHVVFISTDKT